ncbi:MAG TPA: glycosyltransferase family 2 protein [Thermoleophilaceae bacterium]|jgi:GT2 family glycosyltransferase|nr:glycosyltransferase family 2 protein [Thermoleophilaceae bacterium]
MSVSAIIVTYKQIELTLAAIASLERQTVPVDQVIVVDNDPARSAAAPLGAAHRELVVLEEDNIGYAPACNRGAAVASGDWLFFLNPDAEAAPDCLEQLLAAAERHPESGIVTPQVLLPDGRINAGENEIHLTGIAWCGGYGHPPEDGPERPVFITTGAAMLVRRELYERLDGYCDEFFLFYEDPDLCWRAWLVGSEVWYVPRALVRHHYSWGLDNEKWFFLERHRLMSVLTNFRLSTLVLLTPLMVATELALLVVSGREGWRDQKLRAYRSVWAKRSWIRARRRHFAKLRRRPDAAIISGFRATVDSPQITSPVAGAVAPGLRLYAALLRAAVRTIGR